MKGEETESLFAFDSLHSAYCSPEFPAHSCLSPTFNVSGFGWNVSVGAKQYQEQTNREKTSEDVGSGCNIDLAIGSRAPEVTRHSRLLASQPETSQVGFTRKTARLLFSWADSVREKNGAATNVDGMNRTSGTPGSNLGR